MAHNEICVQFDHTMFIEILLQNAKIQIMTQKKNV